MPGMMHSRVSGRGTWCDCCSAWTATRAREKRQWEREAADDAWPDLEREYEAMRKIAIQRGSNE